MTTQNILFYLEEYYPKCDFTYQGDDKIDLNDIIKAIHNVHGNWSVSFYSVPPIDLIITLIYLFFVKFPGKSISITFNSNKETQIVFPDSNLSKIFSYYEQNKHTI